MKKLLYSAAFILSSALILSSCNKGTVSTKKLDGEWDVTSGTIKTTESADGGYSRTETGNFNGSELTTNTTVKYGTGSSTDTYTSTNAMSMSVTFDKKTGEYTMTRVMTTEEDGDYGYYYTFDDNADQYVGEGYYQQRVKRTSTETESGLYTLTGDAGDEIEPNSQIVFQPMEWTDKYTEEYTYEDEDSGDDLDASENYTQDPSNWDDYDELETSDEGTESYNGTGEAYVWNISELKKGEMTVENDEGGTRVDGDGDTYKSETTTNWTLTQK